MGGYGSGRYGGAPVIEDGLVLSISALRRDGLLRSGRWSGRLVWRMVYSGKETSNISYIADIGEETGSWRVIYTTTHADGSKTPSDYTISLISTPQPFGGRRWWFLCPFSGARVAKLYMVPGSTKFAARTAYRRRLAYRSQRAAPFDRACERAWHLRHALGDRHGALGDWIEKPKWMRWQTFEKKLARVRQAEARADALLLWHFRRLAPDDSLRNLL
jgi:hypothetical protein